MTQVCVSTEKKTNNITWSDSSKNVNVLICLIYTQIVLHAYKKKKLKLRS
jgi:hypothetical protein